MMVIGGEEMQGPTVTGYRPRIVIVALVYPPWIFQFFHLMLEFVGNRADLEVVTSALDVLYLLVQNPPPDAVILTDEGVAGPR